MEFEPDLSFGLFTVLEDVSLSQVCFAIFPMDKNIEQRICLKFCIANGISCAELLKMLQKAYGESTLLSKSESVKFSLIESMIYLFTDSSVKKSFSLLNQLIFTEIISEI